MTKDVSGRRIEGVLFDCDGVLVDSERVAIECIVESAAEMGVIYDPEEAERQFTGARMANTVRDIEKRAGRAVPVGFEEDLRAKMARKFEGGLEPMAGAKALIESLSLPFCVASNGPRAKMELTLKVTGLIEYFKGRIVSAYEVGVWKPDPGLFLHAARHIGVEPERCAVVEDSDYGISAGVDAGMQVFALVDAAKAGTLPEGVVAVRGLSELHEIFSC
ncbi:HAD-IA family hydrolase [Thioalkalivibrio sp. HK1]|uniref:HAD-IA family hydrolase n=1 Tax=Thioalkalivibrio sp. HK1 TaxID=1469245 RepID=UPI000472213B|nr:HAD-IA family hydrolase [Thioalkalivibrio sp. HK1]